MKIDNKMKQIEIKKILKVSNQLATLQRKEKYQ